ncbi:UNKNOWN [Stylonychia lemnae]|uniref:Uncharacterized protein n=1 Tax=Stylonychia lemnae TaxID=5949 RepID=A0A078B250_STYLE|nr:UNKNOWN [Stylonychia lemnae]|eukprot:CDW88620.1 UNKNOWN [Stylonychia lemnae]
MSSQSIFIGITVVAPILNQKRYESVFNEILQYLTTHQQDLITQVQNNRFLVFQSSNGSNGDQIILPIQSAYLHTCYFRINTAFQITQEDKKFGSIAWEVVNILKENFPSKIFLSQENLELCKPVFIPLQQTEELRRQISCLMSIKDEDRYLTPDEFEDAWSTLQFAEKINDQRSLNICLELLNHQVNNWYSVKYIVDTDTLLRIISKNDYSQLTSNKLLAQDLLDKVQNALSKEQNSGLMNNNETFDKYQNEDSQSQISDNTCLDMKQYDSKTGAEKPLSTRMCLFQLTESNDINRVTQILQTLSQKSKETLNQLKRKYNFTSKLTNVLRKYCNAEYGFDQISSRHGTFQYNLSKLFIILSSDYVVFLECLQHQTLDFMSQLIEEGVIYAYEDAISGVNNYSNTTQIGVQNSNNLANQGFNQPLFKFLKSSLDFLELAISKNYQEFLPQIRDNLRKIQSRMVKLVQKRENPLLNYFIQNYTGQNNQQNLDEVEDDPSIYIKPLQSDSQLLNQLQQLNVDQLTELKTISQDLYIFAVDLNTKVQRVEALVDLQEEHDEKYERLFYQLIGNPQTFKQANLNEQAQVYDREKQKAQNLKVGNYNNKVQFDLQEEQQQYPQKQPILKTQNSLKKIDQNQIYASNVSLQKENIFMRNQYEGGYEIPEKSYKDKNYNINDKENRNHYIGSPLRQFKRTNTDQRQVSTKDMREYYK